MRSVLSLVLLTLALAFAACGGDESDGTFEQDGFPFTFKYPGDFEDFGDDVDIASKLGAAADGTAAIGISENDVILVQRFTLNLAVERSDLGAAKQQFEQLIRQVDPSATAQPTEVAGLPALDVKDVTIPSVPDGQSRLVPFFDGDQEYLINCQSTPEHRDEIEQACDMALDTVTLDDASG